VENPPFEFWTSPHRAPLKSEVAVSCMSTIHEYRLFSFPRASTASLRFPCAARSMANPGMFHVVITSAFAVMLVFNAVVGLAGYW